MLVYPGMAKRCAGNCRAWHRPLSVQCGLWARLSSSLQAGRPHGGAEPQQSTDEVCSQGAELVPLEEVGFTCFQKEENGHCSPGKAEMVQSRGKSCPLCGEGQGVKWRAMRSQLAGADLNLSGGF